MGERSALIGAHALRRVLGAALAAAALCVALLPGAAMAWPKQAGPFLLVHGPHGALTVDVGTGKVGAPVAASQGGYFNDVAMSYDGRYMLLAESGGACATCLTLVDLSTNTTARRIEVGDMGVARIAVALDGRTVYLAGLRGLAKVDLVTMTLVYFVALDMSAYGVAVTPDGARVFFYDYQQLYVFDPVAKTVKTAFTPDSSISNVAFSPDGKFLYLSKLSAPTILKIDLATMQVVKTSGSAQEADNVLVHPDGKRLYVRNIRPKIGVSVLDAATLSPLATITTSDSFYARQIALSADGGRVFVARFEPALVDVIDTAVNLPVGQYAVSAVERGANPLAAALPSPGLPFAQIGVALLDVAYASDPKKGSFNYYAYVTLNKASDGLRPDLEGLALNVGGLEASVPPGRFVKQADGSYVYNAWVNGVLYNSYVRPAGANVYLLHLLQSGVTLPDIANPVQLRQRVGDDGGVQSVIATITRPVAAAP